MLGYDVLVCTQKDGGASPANFKSACGDRLAWLSPEVSNLRWIREVVLEGNGIDLGGDGYPCRFTVRAGYILPILEQEIQKERPYSRDIIEKDAVAKCRPDEWLLIEIFDQS